MPTLIHSLTQAQVDAVKRARSGSYIFHGPDGMGKARTAYELAALMRCAQPDLITLRPEDKPSILIEQVRTLVQALSLRIYYPDGTRVVVVDEADRLTIEAQNALLKLLEEPPPHTVFILVTSRLEALLPTVRSRCAAIFFPRLPETDIAGFLTAHHGLKPVDAATIARAAEGAPGAAVTLATNRADADARLALAKMATTAITAPLFQRLLLAKQLVDIKADLPRFANLLQSQLVAEFQSGTATPPPAKAFDALERFRRSLSAKVSPRVALERLMLEI